MSNSGTVELAVSVLESSTEYSIIGKDLEGNIVLWNEGARRLYGYEHHEMVGKRNAEILHTPQDVADGIPRKLYDAALKDGKWEGTLERLRKNGERFTAQLVITPRFDSSRNPIGFLLISTDISNETRLANLLELNNRNLIEEIARREASDREKLAAHQELKIRVAELEQNAVDLNWLAEMSELLQSCDTLDEAHSITEEYLQKLYPTATAFVYLARESGDTVHVFASWNGAKLPSKALIEPRECRALRLGKPHVVEDLSGASKCVHLQEAKEGRCICVPMTAHNSIVGMFHVVWANRGSEKDLHSWGNSERLAVAVSNAIVLAITNTKLRKRLEEQAIRDPLTQLYNRRYLEDSLTREVSRARRAGASIGIIMIDVDDFKQFNDSFGHAMGDELLRSLGTYLKSHVRPEDIPCRYGGEEFTLILPGAHSDIVRQRAETLRNGFRAIQTNWEPRDGGVRKPASLSVGVAAFPDHGTSVAEILQSADEALYCAKRSGKDCVVMAANKNNAAAGSPSEKSLMS